MAGEQVHTEDAQVTPGEGGRLTWSHAFAAYVFTLAVLSLDRYLELALGTTPLLSSLRGCAAQVVLIAGATALRFTRPRGFAIGSPAAAVRSQPLLLLAAGAVAAIRGAARVTSLVNYWGDNAIVAARLCRSVILVPIAEEWIFRGVVQTGLRNSFSSRGVRFPAAASVVAAAALFAATHFLQLLNRDFASTVTTVGSAFAFGLVAGYLYHRTRNLWVPTLLHMFGNLAGF